MALSRQAGIAAAGPSLSGDALTEEARPQPVGLYGQSKLKAETAVLDISSQLPVMVLRPSAIYGPYDTNFLQLFRAVKRGFIPHVGRRELYLDVCYVDDLVDGMVAAAESAEGHGEVFFLSGACHTWREIGEAIAHQLDTQVHLLRLPRPLVLGAASIADAWARLTRHPSRLSRTDLLERLQPFWIFDYSKAAHTFGYTPQISLAEGVAKTFRWYCKMGWL